MIKTHPYEVLGLDNEQIQDQWQENKMILSMLCLLRTFEAMGLPCIALKVSETMKIKVANSPCNLEQ